MHLLNVRLAILIASGYSSGMAKKRAPKKAPHGGPREGAGRPPLADADKRRKRTVWLTDDEAALVTRLGGTLSEGVQRLIALASSQSPAKA